MSRLRIVGRNPADQAASSTNSQRKERMGKGEPWIRSKSVRRLCHARGVAWRNGERTDLIPTKRAALWWIRGVAQPSAGRVTNPFRPSNVRKRGRVLLPSAVVPGEPITVRVVIESAAIPRPYAIERLWRCFTALRSQTTANMTLKPRCQMGSIFDNIPGTAPQVTSHLAEPSPLHRVVSFDGTSVEIDGLALCGGDSIEQTHEIVRRRHDHLSRLRGRAELRGGNLARPQDMGTFSRRHR